MSLTIETKFDTNQEVWFMKDNRCQNAIVSRIFRYVQSGEIGYTVTYDSFLNGVKFSQDIKEVDLFASKELLKESL